MPPRTGFSLVDAEADRREPEVLAARTVPRVLHDLRASAPTFVAPPKLVSAVNVALAVGAPLLLTGEPGTGKTQVAYWLWWYFRIDEIDKAAAAERGREGDERRPPQPFSLQVKSTTCAEDLLYTFDTVAYFHASRDPAWSGRDLGEEKWRFRKRGPLWWAFEDMDRGRPAIVLIDEIDKAPRDFPNDLLHELDQFAFTCDPTGERVERPEGSPPPLVVITSNSERRLPEPFLRRCIFHHLELDGDTLREAVRRRGEHSEADIALQEAAIARFWELRERARLRKKPSTGELFAWLAALRAEGVIAKDLRDASRRSLPHVGALVKDREDLEKLG